MAIWDLIQGCIFLSWLNSCSRLTLPLEQIIQSRVGVATKSWLNKHYRFVRLHVLQLSTRQKKGNLGNLVSRHFFIGRIPGALDFYWCVQLRYPLEESVEDKTLWNRFLRKDMEVAEEGSSDSEEVVFFNSKQPKLLPKGSAVKELNTLKLPRQIQL